MAAPSAPSDEARPTRGSRRWTWPTRTTLSSMIIAACLTGGLSYTATSWTLQPPAATHGRTPSAPVTNLNLSAVAAPTPFPASLLYPGASGAITATISNPNPFKVTITALKLPSNTSYAAGYTDATLTNAQDGCSVATPSGVTW